MHYARLEKSEQTIKACWKAIRTGNLKDLNEYLRENHEQANINQGCVLRDANVRPAHLERQE